MQINLLPWREQDREMERKKFFVLFGSMIGFAFFVIFILHVYVNNHLKQQVKEMSYLKEEISHGQLETNMLLKQKEELPLMENQLKFLQKLKLSGLQIVSLLNELVKIVPPSISLTRIIYSKRNTIIDGIAQSDWQITHFIRNISRSSLFKQPEIIQISNKPEKADEKKYFQLKVAYKE
jgi:type IV pilus assembly protein PilN